MMKNMSQMLKMAQEAQERLTSMQAAMANFEAEGEAGGGLVKLRLNGKGRMIGLKVDPSIVSADDVELLEDLILAAHNDARTKIDARTQDEMSKLAGGLPLPPGFQMPF